MDVTLIVGILFSISTLNNSVRFNDYLTNSGVYNSLQNHCYHFEYDPDLQDNVRIFDIVDNVSTLKIGIFEEDSVYYQYESIIRCSFPLYDVDYIDNASLSFNKSSGYAQTIDVEYSYDYSFGNDPTDDDYAWNTLGSLSMQGNTYSINLTNLLISSINNNKNYFYLKLSKNGSVSLTCQSVYLTNDPKFQVKYNLFPSLLTTGCATPYQYIEFGGVNNPDDFVNCYAYAIDIKGNSNFTLFKSTYRNNHTENEFINYIINVSKFYFNVNMRQISDYNSPIYSFERRIGFQYNISQASQVGSFHFIRQTSNGYWASSNFEHRNTKIHYWTNPNNYDWGEPWGCSQFYNSNKIYFAISTLGGISCYATY